MDYYCGLYSAPALRGRFERCLLLFVSFFSSRSDSSGFWMDMLYLLLQTR